MKRIFSQTIGFTGCKIARRVFGIAGVEDIRDIENKRDKKEAELMALRMGKELILDYKDINGIDALIMRLKSI